MRSYKRSDRVASLVLQALSESILLHVRDARVQGVVVTHVKMTPDMSIARAYVRSLTNDEAGRRHAMAGLEAVKGFLRSEIARQVKLLRVPQLEFFYDEIPDKAARVDEILRGLKNES